jgi:hypothetical protein
MFENRMEMVKGVQKIITNLNAFINILDYLNLI